ncbi:MAG: hypothetical protein ACLU9S_10345 [Oscillospiraceae bacterium]
MIVILQKLIWGIAVPGYATIIVLILLLGGLQLFCLGLIGEYIGKIFEQSKHRPVYLEKKSFFMKKAPYNFTSALFAPHLWRCGADYQQLLGTYTQTATRPRKIGAVRRLVLSKKAPDGTFVYLPKASQ